MIPHPSVLNSGTADGGYVLLLATLGVALLLLAYARRVRRQRHSGAALLQSLLDHTDNAVMALDAALRVTFVNRRYLELWQLDEAFLQGRPRIGEVIAELCRRGLYPADQAEALVARRLEQLRGALETAVLETPRLDGVMVEGFAARLPDGGYLLTFRDVTRRQRAEAELQRSQEHLHTLVETVPHGILECDLQGQVTFVNSAYARMQELISGEAPVGRTIFELIGDEQGREQARARFARHLAEGRSHGSELVGNRDRGGQLLWRQVDWALRRDVAGAPDGFIAVVTDVTERLRDEEQVMSTHVALRRILQDAPLAIAALDAAGALTVWNRAAERLLGWGQAEVLGGGLEFLPMYADQREAFEHLLASARRGETVRRELTLLPRGGGTLDVSISVGPLAGLAEEAGEMVLVIDDISERRRIELALRHSEETYRNLVEVSPVAVFIHIDGYLVFLNPAAVQLFGAAAAEELEGRALADYLDAESRMLLRTGLAAVEEDEGKTNQMALRILQRNDEPREVEATFLGVDYNGCEARLAICLDVTERNRAEQALRDSERKYRAIFDQAFQFSGLLDAEGRLLAANRSALEFIGRREEEVRGQFFWETPWWAPFPEYQQRVREAVRRAVEGEWARFEVVNRGRNGEDLWIDFSLRPVRDDWGQVIYLVPEGRDITERKRSEELTLLVARGVSGETGEGFFRSLTRYLGQALGADYAFIGEISDAMVHVVAGVGRGQELLPFSYPLADTPCAEVMASAEVCVFPAAIGRDFPQDQLLMEMQVEGYAGSPLRDAEGRALGILVVLFAKPIRHAGQVESLLRIFASRAAAELERRRAERVLEASEARFRQLSHEFETIFDGIPDSLTVWTPERRLVWSNRASAAFFRPLVGEPSGRSCQELCLLDDCVEKECELQRCIAHDRVEDIVHTTSDGRSWGIKTFPLHDESGALVRVIRLASDISERIRLREDAARASHLAALGELAAGVAHEINNPTGLILLDMPIIRDAFRDALPLLEAHYQKLGDYSLAGLDYSLLREQLPQLLAEVLDGAQRIKQIVDELKDFARPFDARQFVAVDLGEVVRKAAQLVGNQLKKATDHFTLHCPESPIFSTGNAQRLEQVIINLLLNACQALSAREQAISVTVRRAPDGTGTQIEVRDEGVGINPEHLKQITDPFFTTRREVGGTGLGLSVSTRIVEEHGGTLHFASDPGRGTVVTVSLPLAGQGEEP